MAPAPENAEAIVARLNVILAESDLEETSIKDVHKALEKEFEVSIDQAFLREHVHAYLVASARARYTTSQKKKKSLTPCSGNGACREQCLCECYTVDDDEEYGHHEVWDEVCTCGHRAHQGENWEDEPGLYCPDISCGDEACALVPCMACEEDAPPWLMDCHGGFCSPDCAMEMDAACGPVTRVREEGECPICLETRPLIALNACGHAFCVRCRIKDTRAKLARAREARGDGNVFELSGDGTVLPNDVSVCALCRRANPGKIFAAFEELCHAQHEYRVEDKARTKTP